MVNFLNRKTLHDVNLKNQTVIVRLDFNVPIKQGVIQDPKRIVATLPTLNYLLEHNCKIIILSHLSRIKTLEDINSGTKSLAPVAKKLQELLPSNDVMFCPASVGSEVLKQVQTLQPRQILLLENTRYNDVTLQNEVVKLESKCDLELGKFWASLADIFVNDAFGTVHRRHASNYGIAVAIKTSCIGFLIQKELENLAKLTYHPKTPVVAILGGAKVSDKLNVISNLINVADRILICGGMAYTFLKAQGHSIGFSLCEEEMIPEATKLLNIAKEKLFLPLDFYCAKTFTDVEPIYKKLGENLTDLMSLDIGPLTVKYFRDLLQTAGTVFWNGPAGVFEFSHFQSGTKNICQILKELNSHGIFTLIGGGDSAAAAVALGFNESDFGFISTGGGASLAVVEGSNLPGIEAIQIK